MGDGSGEVGSKARSNFAVLLMASAMVATVGFGGVFALLLGVDCYQAFIISTATALVGVGASFAVMGWRERQRNPQPHHTFLEKLTEQLTQSTSRDDVVSVIERNVRLMIECEEVSFLPSLQDGAGDDQNVNPTLRIRSLLHGQPVSLLLVTKQANATFTDQEVTLLRTIANQATLALPLVARATMLDKRRREQAEAWERERAAIIEALAAEIAHEVRYPINFFRSVFSRENENRQLDDEELEIGCEEVERLERLVTDLRKVAVRQLERREVQVTEVIARAEMLLRDRLDGRTFELSVPDKTRVRCDPDQITQVLVNLMSNAVSATKEGQDIGIEWQQSESGATLTVWDGGDGFVCPPSMIFTPWFTTKSTGTGLGLAITHRITRAHGWTVDPRREDEHTKIVLTIPAADIVNDDESTSLPYPADDVV